MKSLDVFTFVLLIIALTFGYRLIKTWLHYVYGSARANKKQENHQEQYHDIVAKADRLEERISQLERILDRDLPGWEKRS